MYNRELYSRAVRLQKTAVDNTFSIFSTMHGHGKRLLKKSLEHNPWITEGSRKTCTYFSDTCLDGSNYLKNFIDQGFEEMEKLFSADEEAKKTDKQPVKAAGDKTAPDAGKATEKEPKVQSDTKTAGKTAAAATTTGKVESPAKSARQTPSTAAGSAAAKLRGSTRGKQEVRESASSKKS